MSSLQTINERQNEQCETDSQTLHTQTHSDTHTHTHTPAKYGRCQMCPSPHLSHLPRQPRLRPWLRPRLASRTVTSPLLMCAPSLFTPPTSGVSERRLFKSPL